MPHRVINEAAAGMTLITASLTNWISDKDWERMIGPWGGLLLSVIMCAILLRHSAKRLKREDERSELDRAERETRHKEQMAMQRENSDKLMALTVESIKAKGMMATAINRLTDELEGHPCLQRANLPRVNFDGEKES